MFVVSVLVTRRVDDDRMAAAVATEHMPRIEVVTRIDAPRERCFDLARSIDLHRRSLDDSGERAVAGVTHGLIGAGQTVTWEARHFGVRQRLTVRITAFDPPSHFRDSMLAGAFRRFDHDHRFEADAHGGTIMSDAFDYEAPFGVPGRVVAALVLNRYMRRLLVRRNAVVKQVAESDEWRAYLRSEVPGSH
jgi:ligand-binding SRPBCC domain-containing protein